MVELVGMKLGRYAIFERVNDPRQDNVYLVEQAQDGPSIAARVYTQRSRRNDVWMAKPATQGDDQRFLARLTAITQLQHPNLLPILEVGEQDELLYVIVPAWFDGSLAEFIQPATGYPLPWPRSDVLALIRPLAEGLQALHDRGITHGSIEPWTVLVHRLPQAATSVPERGRQLDPQRIALVLSDFGLGRFFGAPGAVSAPSTISCAAPETTTRFVTPASDQYSLAYLMYWLLTGTSATQTRASSPVPPALPAAVDAVFTRALQADPTRRFPEVRDFVAALAAVWNTNDSGLTALGASRQSFAPRPGESQPLSRRQAMINITGCVAVGLAAATGVAYAALAPRQRLPSPSVRSNAAKSGDSIGLFRPTANTLYLMSSLTLQAADIAVNFGGPTGLPIAGDWNGDGVDAVGIFTPEAGTFQLLDLNQTPKQPAYTIYFGTKGDIPVAGDWTGSGRDGIGVFRQGTFYLKNTLDNKPPDFVFNLGAPGDFPVVGDWNGDGVDGIGVYRPSLDAFFLADTVCNLCATQPRYTVELGVGAGLPLAGNWLGQEGRSGVGLFLPSAAMVFLKKDATHLGPPDFHVVFGRPGDLPVAGHWTT